MTVALRDAGKALPIRGITPSPLVRPFDIEIPALARTLFLDAENCGPSSLGSTYELFPPENMFYMTGEIG